MWDELSRSTKDRINLLAIAFLSLLVFFLMNFNFYLIWSGVKYQAEVKSVSKQVGKSYQILIEYERNGGEIVKRTISDGTQDLAFYVPQKGDFIAIFESKTKPYSYYVPRIAIVAKAFVLLFFVFVPLIFAIFGKSTH